MFKDFENYFGCTEKLKIETTYRFNNPLINLSSEFILKNPNQTHKQLKGLSKLINTSFEIYYSISENQDDTFEVLQIFNKLLRNIENIQKKEILILGRYSFDIDRIKNEKGFLRIDKQEETISYSINKKDGTTKSIKAQFMTIHKAKGIEADIVIVLNCNSGKYGFPSEISDDKVLNLLLSEADQYDNGEERRLFYVAMTRAKEYIYFVANSFCKSKFISELEIESRKLPSKKCPVCKTGDVVLKKSGTSSNGSAYKFYGCSNYLFGCEYFKKDWETPEVKINSI